MAVDTRDSLADITDQFPDAARRVREACDQARVAFWRKLPHVLEALVPGLVCPPQGEADACRMEAWADHMAEQPFLLSAEARDIRALRLYAAEVRAAAKTEIVHAA